MKKARVFLRYALLLLFPIGALLSNAGFSVPAFLTLGALAIIESLLYYQQEKTVFSPAFLLSLSWLGGISLSALKLSSLQSVWEVKTWILTGVFYLFFISCYDIFTEITERRPVKKAIPESSDSKIFWGIVVLFSLSLIAFLAECFAFSFQIPLFVKDTPHAYTEFHLTGVHYFVVSSALIPALCVYGMNRKNATKRQKRILLGIGILSLSIPIMLLSKLNIAISFILPVITYGLIKKDGNKKKRRLIGGISVVLIIVLFAAAVSLRHYPEGYLNSIFQFRNVNTPVAVQYPYIYVVNNFENLNLLVKNSTEYAYGTRTFFPVFALTGLKFTPLYQNIAVLENYYTIAELTTGTILYETYADFHMLSGVLIGIGTGILSAFSVFLFRRRKNLFTVFNLALLCIYLGLSFFSSWFSLPVVWFWAVLLLALGLIEKKKGESIW